VSRDIFDLVEETTWVRPPRELVTQDVCKPVGSIADHQLGRVCGHPLGMECCAPGLPSGLVLARGPLPGHDLPVAIWPHPQGAQDDTFLLALRGAAPAWGVFPTLPWGGGNFHPHTSDEKHGRRRRDGGRLEGLTLLCQAEHDAMARRHRPHLPQGPVPAFGEVPSTEPETGAQDVLVEPRSPAAVVAFEGLPRPRIVAPPSLRDPQVWNPSRLGAQRPAIAATARGCWATAPGQLCVARTAQRRGSCFLQGLFNAPLDGRHDGGVDVLADLTLAMAGEARTIAHLSVVIKVALVVALLGMAHRDIPPLNQVVQ